MSDQPPIPHPDPPPLTWVILLPGDEKTFFFEGHTYALSKSNQVLQDNVPLADTFGMGQVVFLNLTLYCQDVHTMAWYQMDGQQLVPSLGPWVVPPNPPDVSYISPADAAALQATIKTLMDQLATVIVTASGLAVAIDRMTR